MSAARRAFALAPTLLLGCASEPQTCNLATGELVMVATITELNGVVEVEVEFERVEGDATLELCPDRDRLTVNGLALESIRVFGAQYYRLELDAPAERYELDLARDGADDVRVAIDMPPSFAITTPEPGASASRSQPLAVEWTPAWPDHTIEVVLLDDIGSSCIDGLGIFDEVEDSGAHAIGGASIAAADSGQDCELSLLLTRERIIEHPSGGYAGGSITGSRTQALTVISTP